MGLSLGASLVLCRLRSALLGDPSGDPDSNAQPFAKLVRIHPNLSLQCSIRTGFAHFSP
jgi:hypothetical protein